MRQSIILISRYIEYDLKNEIYQHYQALDFSFFRKGPRATGWDSFFVPLMRKNREWVICIGTEFYLNTTDFSIALKQSGTILIFRNFFGSEKRD